MAGKEDFEVDNSEDIEEILLACDHNAIDSSLPQSQERYTQLENISMSDYVHEPFGESLQTESSFKNSEKFEFLSNDGDLENKDVSICTDINDQSTNDEITGEQPLKMEEEMKKIIINDKEIKDNQGNMVAHADEIGHLDDVQHMNAAEIDEVNDWKRTALFVAAQSVNLEIAQYLVGSGADIHAKDKRGQTPLHRAAESGHPDIVTFLINNANVAAQDNRGQTPLHLAARSGHQNVAEVLINNNANVAAQDNLGQTPLHRAARSGHQDVIEFLINNNANSFAQDNLGVTPLDHVLKIWKSGVVESIFLL